MDITIYDIAGSEPKELLTFPMLPEQISVTTSAKFHTYDIMSVGEIKIPVGENLTGFSWKGTLPGKIKKTAPYIMKDKWLEPKTIQGMLSIYRVQGKKLKLVVTETPISHEVYLDNYTVDYAGPSGDYNYTIQFVVAKELKIYKDGEQRPGNPFGLTGTNNYSNTLNSRPVPPVAKTYTVKKGDSLWRIAEILLGDGKRYKEIYELNKSLIGKDPSKIYPGQVLNIPQGIKPKQDMLQPDFKTYADILKAGKLEEMVNEDLEKKNGKDSDVSKKEIQKIDSKNAINIASAGNNFNTGAIISTINSDKKNEAMFDEFIEAYNEWIRENEDIITPKEKDYYASKKRYPPGYLIMNLIGNNHLKDKVSNLINLTDKSLQTEYEEYIKIFTKNEDRPKEIKYVELKLFATICDAIWQVVKKNTNATNIKSARNTMALTESRVAPVGLSTVQNFSIDIMVSLGKDVKMNLNELLNNIYTNVKKAIGYESFKRIFKGLWNKTEENNKDEIQENNRRLILIKHGQYKSANGPYDGFEKNHYIYFSAKDKTERDFWEDIATIGATDFVFIPEPVEKVEKDSCKNLCESIKNLLKKKSDSKIWIGTLEIHANNSSTVAVKQITNFLDEVKNNLGSDSWSKVAGIYMNQESIYASDITYNKIDFFTHREVDRIKSIKDYITKNYSGKKFLWIPYYEYGTNEEVKKRIVSNIAYLSDIQTIFDYVIIQPHYFFYNEGTSDVDNLKAIAESTLKNAVYNKQLKQIISPKTSKTEISFEMECGIGDFRKNASESIKRYAEYIYYLRPTLPHIYAYFWQGDIWAIKDYFFDKFFKDCTTLSEIEYKIRENLAVIDKKYKKDNNL